MAESLSPLSKEETLALVRRTYQEVIDTLLFISDEMEMQCLPTRDGASALRMAAGLLALTKESSVKNRVSVEAPSETSGPGARSSFCTFGSAA